MYSFSEYQSLDEGKKKGLWANIHAKRKRGEKPAKPGDKDYPETLKVEGYKGKHGQTDKQYADSRSPGGKMVSGDSKRSGAEYTHGRRVKAANPGMQPDVGGKTKPKSQGKMDRGTRADLQYRKANLKKEGYAPGDVDQKLGAVTAIPKKDQEEARKRLLAKAAAKRKSLKKEDFENINEEEYDRMRDRKLEKYGSGYRSAGNRRYTARSGGTQPKPMPKKKDGPSALDFVKGEIEKKYGKGAIMDTSKKKK